MIRAANCNRELRTAFLNRLQLSLGQPFWTDFSSLLNSLSDRDFSQRLDSLSDTDFSSLLDSFSEQTSAIDLTVFLNRLQRSLGQLFWTDFGYRLDSLSEQTSALSWTVYLTEISAIAWTVYLTQTSALSWTAFLNRLQPSLWQPFWAELSCRLAVVLSVSVQSSQNTRLLWHIQFNREKNEKFEKL